MLQKAPSYTNPTQVKNDILSGLTVALALVPEAIAFAFIAGISPVIGLYSAFFIGLITAIFGGRPGMISGATGAMAVVVIGLVSIHGVAYLFPTVILCGILQILVGAARLGKLIRMVPHPVMLGFVNGLAIVIFLAQFGSFKGFDITSGSLAYLPATQMGIMLALVGLTMLIIWGLPKITKAVPSSLAAILIVTFISIAINGASTPDTEVATLLRKQTWWPMWAICCLTTRKLPRLKKSRRLKQLRLQNRRSLTVILPP